MIWSRSSALFRMRSPAFWDTGGLGYPHDSGVAFANTFTFTPGSLSSRRRSKMATRSLCTSNTSNDANATRPSSGMARTTSKRKLALVLGYDGAPYHGLQRNVGVRTVLDEVEEALHECGLISPQNFGHLAKVGLSVAARTDKGVSSAGNIIAFKGELERGEVAHSPAALDAITHAINAALPDHVRIFRTFRVTSSFSARNQCDERSYEYLIPMNVVEGDLDRFHTCMQRFCGSHFFHNYTVGTSHAVPPRPQARRVIREVKCHPTPFLISAANGTSAQWARISIRGQSFMLHQIRKMVAMGLLVHTGILPNDALERSLDATCLLNIPPAPAVGLFLDYCNFGNYNARQEQLARPVDVVELEDERERFKTDVIFPSIARRAQSEDDMKIFFETVDRHSSSLEDMTQPPNSNASVVA